jgi:hypothetical protein
MRFDLEEMSLAPIAFHFLPICTNLTGLMSTSDEPPAAKCESDLSWLR